MKPIVTKWLPDVNILLLHQLSVGCSEELSIIGIDRAIAFATPRFQTGRILNDDSSTAVGHTSFVT